ncbi:hypothetical protein [Arthrobacter luteolus]|uniref:hypothetical protein n=1 Tax=Arthrobacter luteolus TaxID=98672 RepID=UPI00384A550A
MPASAETVIAYLTFMATAVRPDGKHAYAQSTIVRRASFVNAQQVAAGVAPQKAQTTEKNAAAHHEVSVASSVFAGWIPSCHGYSVEKYKECSWTE